MKEEFKPYVPADKVTPEFTVTSIILGVFLAVVFGIGDMIDLSASVDTGLIGGLILMAAMIAAVMKFAMTKEPAKADGKDSKKES